MTSPRGTQFELYGLNELAESTPPSGNWLRLPIVSADLGGTQDLVAETTLSRALGRNAPEPFHNNLEVPISVEVPMDRGNLGFWLTLMFGAATTTGAGPFTDVWTPRSAGTALPTASLEGRIASAAVTRFHLRSAVKANTLAIRVDPTAGLQTMSVGLIGRAATDSASSVAGTPTTATFLGHLKQRWVVSVDNIAVGNVTGLELNISNGLDPYMTVRDQPTGAAFAIDEGALEITGSFTFRSADSRFFDDAEALTSRELTLLNTIATNDHLTLDMGNVFLARPSAPVQGPGAIQQTVRFRAAFDTSDTTMFTATRVRSA